MFKKNKNKIYFLLGIVILILVYMLAGCSSVKTPECINKSAVSAEISWGVMQKGIAVKTYNMKMSGELTIEENGKKTEITVMSMDSLCSVLSELGNIITEVQTLNVPADMNNFIEYKNKPQNYYFLAVWNPEHTNDGNMKFKEFYNRLINLAK